MTSSNTTNTGVSTPPGDDILVRVENVSKGFTAGARTFSRLSRRVLFAVDGVSLDIMRGETLGLVGESGSGKSTLARCILRLQDLSAGRVVFDGDDISHLSRNQLRPFRSRMQLIFQDPYGSLNPKRRIGSIIADPLVIHNRESGDDVRQRVEELMRLVGLDANQFNRFPAQFSGGQRQRIGIARALALQPEFVVCDEPVSALDISIRAQIINLLADLQNEFALTYLFIAHDLSIVRHVSDRVGVMYLGKIVEIARTNDLYDRPRHPYTAALLSAAPAAEPKTKDRKRRILLSGDVPSPFDQQAGCRFRNRCPREEKRCAIEEPQLISLPNDEPGHASACHFPLDDGEEVRLRDS